MAGQGSDQVTQQQEQQFRATTDDTEEVRTIRAVRGALEAAGYIKTAGDRHEHPRATLAVETGYVYREITARIWETNKPNAGKEGTRNVGAPMREIRGLGTQMADDVLAAVVECLDRLDPWF